MDLLALPLASAEFLAVDTETNGLWGDECELTEVGCVLVGGGELHDRWSSVVRTNLPLRRGIQRFTGITQAMVDAAPRPEAVLPGLARRMEGRVLVAHNAGFDERVLKQAFDRAGIDWPAPPVFCTVSLARKFAPLIRRRGLASLADSLGIQVDEVHRALPDAVTCGQVLCALLPKLCANAITIGDALGLLGPRRRAPRKDKAPGRYRPPEERPDLSQLPKDPGVYIFRDIRGRPLYVGKSVSLRTRARAHFCAPAGWTERAEIVDYKATNSELGALILENRLIKQWRPAGNTALKRTDRWAYVRCRLDVEYPILEVSSEPAPGHAVNIGPLRGKRLAGELADQLSSLFKLRHCGRALRRREHPSIYGQMDRCCSPCLGDLDPNAYRGQIDKAMALFDSPGGARDALLDEIEGRLRAASAARRYEAAAALLRRRERVEILLERLGGVLRAVDAAPRLVVAAHPAGEGHDAFWIVAGRIVDWGPLPPALEIRARSRAALAQAPPARSVPPDAVDEVRIAAAWIAEHEPPAFPLELAADPQGGLGRWLSGARRRKAPRPEAVAA